MKDLPKLVAIGGYLGSGKTTLIIAIGKKLASERGMKIAVVTNDQGDELVDSKLVGELGLPFTEVHNGCFCCRFPEFITKVHEILAKVKPDMILAEPVGSCTDLIATVYNPISEYYKDELSIAPYVVLVDAKRLLDLTDLDLKKDRQLMLMSWQLREADVVGINKVDLISPSELDKVKDVLRKLYIAFEELELLPISAKTGYNLDKLCEIILKRDYRRKGGIDVNYDVYAAAEADLGWFNGSFVVKSKEPVSVEEVIKHLLLDAGKKILEKGGRIAHLKLYCSTKEGLSKASLVDMKQGVLFDLKPPLSSNELRVVLNIRAELSPEEIEGIVRQVLNDVVSKYGAESEGWSSRSFRPRYPHPYYHLP